MKKLRLLGALLITAIVLFAGCSEVERYPIPTGDSGDGSGPYVKSDPQEFLTEPIAGQYIIVLYGNEALRGNDPMMRDKAMELLRGVGASEEGLGFVYAHSILGFSAQMDPVMAEIMQANPEVAYVEQDQRVTINQFDATRGKPSQDVQSPPPSQTTPGGIALHGSRSGNGKKAWIIDSGIDLDHSDLNVSGNWHKNQGESRSFLGGKEWNNPDDQHGHGTHVAGTVAAIDNNIGVIGVAEGATVVAVRVLDRRGSGSYSGVIAGIDYVASEAASTDAANMSLGGGYSKAVNDAVDAAAQTCPFAVAAGNDARDAAGYSPASATGANVYTVSAMNTSSNWAYFSNYGDHTDFVDYCAVGMSVYSCYKGDSYTTMSGTSMASPHMCGILLLGNYSTKGYVSNDPDGNADPIAKLN